MKIALINPNTSRATTAAMVGIASETTGQEATVHGFTAGFGASLLTGPDDLDVAADAVVALSPNLTGCDAVVVSAFGDPGLSALREVVGVPVTGIAEAGMKEAAAGGRRFAVVTTTPELAERIALTAAHCLHKGFLGTWTTHGDPFALTAKPVELEAALARAINRAVNESGAEAIVIGGGPLAQAARVLAAQSPVPLVQPIPAAVRLTFERLGVEMPV